MSSERGHGRLPLQDFTMLKGYCTHYNYKDNMVFLQDMLCSVSKNSLGIQKSRLTRASLIFAGKWPVITFRDLILNDCGIDIKQCQSSAQLLDEIHAWNIQLESETEIFTLGRENLIALLHKKVSRPKLISPTLLVQHPKHCPFWPGPTMKTPIS